MKTTSTLILAAFAAVAQAAKFTNAHINPEPNQPFELTWSDAEGPVTILLKTGPSDNLDTVETLASDIQGDSVTVTLNAADFPSGIYAFEIVDSTGPNYSQQFSFHGTGSISSPSASATGSATTGTGVTSVSVTATPSHASNSASGTRTASGTQLSTASGTTTGRPSQTSAVDDVDDLDEVPDVSAGNRDLSPLALIFVTAAAMMYFN